MENNLTSVIQTKLWFHTWSSELKASFGFAGASAPACRRVELSALCCPLGCSCNPSSLAWHCFASPAYLLLLAVRNKQILNFEVALADARSNSSCKMPLLLSP